MVAVRRLVLKEWHAVLIFWFKVIRCLFIFPDFNHRTIKVEDINERKETRMIFLQAPTLDENRKSFKQKQKQLQFTERERERETKTETEKEIERDREKERQRERERERQTERVRDRERETERERQTDRERYAVNNILKDN